MATHSSVLAWRIPGTDGGAWWAAAYWVAQSRTRLKQLSSSSSSNNSPVPRWKQINILAQTIQTFWIFKNLEAST